jgi:hypothetical protein
MNIFYGSVDYDLSDHKPITGLFEAKIKVIDDTIKSEFIQKVIDNY